MGAALQRITGGCGEAGGVEPRPYAGLESAVRGVLRIVTPVCGLVRNDIDFGKRVQCVRDDVGIVPYEINKAPVGPGSVCPAAGVQRVSAAG